MNVIQCQQYSPEWWTARRGILTASEFGSILTPKTGKLSASADGYIARLIGDLFDPLYPRQQEAVSAAMKHGTDTEAEARKWFEMVTDKETKQVGFVLDDKGRFGCSPDALIPDEGVLELKCPQPATQIQYLLANELPAEYRAQCHGQLIVCDVAYVQFVSYCPGLPTFTQLVTKDAYTDLLRDALDQFYLKFQTTLALIRSKA